MDTEKSVETKIDYPEDLDPRLEGLGGWFVFTIIILFLKLFAGAISLFGDGGLEVLSRSATAAEYITLFYSVIILIILSAVILRFIFKRNIMFRKFLVIAISIDIVFLVLSVVLLAIASSIVVDPLYPQAYSQAIGSAIFQSVAAAVISVAWIIYLYRSYRVKNTFIYIHEYEDAFIKAYLPYSRR